MAATPSVNEKPNGAIDHPLEPTALATIPERVLPTPLPIFTGSEMASALTAYRELQTALDRSMPEQIIKLDGKPFRKKGYWRAIAVAFNLTVEVESERREIYGDLEDGSPNYAYLITYRASTTAGRSETGDGACAAAEKSRGRMKASEHNVRSHAHTRAFNRAVSNLVGFGEVSAEEIERDEHGSPAPKPTLLKPTGYDEWLDDMRSTADEGEAALLKAWGDSPKPLRHYLRMTDLATWTAIKAHAVAVKPKADASPDAEPA